MGDRIRITDVSPRDGLQNEARPIPTEAKAGLVAALVDTGVDEIEITSFVSPRWIPQLGDAPELCRILRVALARTEDRDDDGNASRPLLSALVPNERGMLAALNANAVGAEPLIDKVAVFTSASETFSEKNINASIAESIERFRPVMHLAREHGLAVRGYVSCAVACPFEGAIEPGAVGDVVSALLDIGVGEIDLGDTIGAGTPETVGAVVAETMDRLEGRALGERGEPTLTLHLHDTFGGAAACVEAALDLGVRSFDGSAAGLGGCPYASTPGRRAPGNIATELLVRTVEGAGFRTGVSRKKLEEAARIARTLVGLPGAEIGA